jgi:hypothetical protein
MEELLIFEGTAAAQNRLGRMGQTLTNPPALVQLILLIE